MRSRRAKRRRNQRNRTRGRVGARKVWHKSSSRRRIARIEEDPHGRREPKRRRKAQGSQEDDDTLANREVVRVNNGLEQYGVSIDSVGTHVKLCLRSNVHAKKQLAAALRLLLEVPNNLLRWHFFLRSEYIPAPTKVVSTLRTEAYKYKDYSGLHFLRQPHKMTRTDRTDRTEPFISLRVKTGLDRSGPVFEQTA